MEREIVGMLAGKLLDSVKSDLRGVIKIVNDDGLEAAEEELEDSVAANVAGAAGD